MRAGQLLNHARHAIGGPAADEIGGMWIVNQAGRHVYQMHSWASALRGSATLSYVSGQNWIALPVDFQELEGVWFTGNSMSRSERVPMATLIGLRQRSSSPVLTPTGLQVVAVAHTGTGGVPRLELLYTPSAVSAAVLTIAYVRKWVDVADDEDTVTIAPELEGLLVQSVRAHAKGIEAGDIEQRLVLLRAGEVFRAAARTDGSADVKLGPMLGGAARGPWPVLQGWPSNQIAEDPA